MRFSYKILSFKSWKSLRIITQKRIEWLNNKKRWKMKVIISYFLRSPMLRPLLCTVIGIFQHCLHIQMPPEEREGRVINPHQPHLLFFLFLATFLSSRRLIALAMKQVSACYVSCISFESLWSIIWFCFECITSRSHLKDAQSSSILLFMWGWKWKIKDKL